MGKFCLAFWLTLLCVATGTAVADDWLTYYEKSGFLETPRYDETVAYCQRLADYSDMLEFRNFGVSPQGRYLPLLILDRDRGFDPQGPKTKQKAVLLYEAGIHPGEIEGKDAGLLWLRDVVVHGKYTEMLDNVVVLFIPIFNVDGHERFGPYNRANQNGPMEMGWRTSAQNLNLNRDFLKADSPEMIFWLELFNRWLPDFLVDIHTTDGADYQYVITYALETNTNVAAPLADWSRTIFLPEFSAIMENAGYPFVPYIVPRHDHDVTSGLMYWTGTPRYSNGYGAAQNRPFMLIETHMLKDYKTRVESVYELMVLLTDYVNSNAAKLKEVVYASDGVTARGMTGRSFPLRYRPSGDSVMTDFLGVDFSFRESEISADSIVVWGDKKINYRIPVFSGSKVVDSASIPYAYLIPQEWIQQINLLQLQGIRVNYLTEAVELEVESYRFSEPKWRDQPFEGRFLLDVQAEPLVEVRSYPAGTAVVVMNQRTNRVAAHLLEPRAPDSFVRWGFFDVIFERKEYIEDYFMEPLAAKMLAEDTALADEFRQKLASDSTFAADPDARLDFFYQRTPFFDERENIYPIGKLMIRGELPLQ